MFLWGESNRVFDFVQSWAWNFQFKSTEFFLREEKELNVLKQGESSKIFQVVWLSKKKTFKVVKKQSNSIKIWTGDKNVNWERFDVNGLV